MLNELSDNSFEGSVIEKEPVNAIGEVIRQLTLAKHEWELKEKYAGQTEEEIAAAQAAEREQELADLQQHFADRLNETAERVAGKTATSDEMEPNQPQTDQAKETDKQGDTET